MLGPTTEGDIEGRSHRGGKEVLGGDVSAAAAVAVCF